MRRPSGALWSHPDFLKLWTGQTISEFGSQVSQLAIPAVAVLTLKATPFQVAALETVVFLPFLLLTLPAGVWVDRLAAALGPDRRRPRAGRAARHDPTRLRPRPADAHTALRRRVPRRDPTVFFDVAYQSYLPQLVDRETLVEGNSKLQMTVSGAAIAGPGLAGGLIALAGAPYAVLVDACSFVVSGGFTAAIRKREDPPPTQRGRRRLLVELWEGLRYVTHHQLLFPQAIATGSSNFLPRTSSSPCTSSTRYRHLGLTPALMGVIGAIGRQAGSSARPRPTGFAAGWA